MYDIIIIGAGPAGLTAALYARRAERSTLVLERALPGGQITFSPEVENYPAIAFVSGPDYAQALQEQAVGLGAELRLEEALSLEQIEGGWVVTTPEGQLKARAVILANGVKRRTLGVPGEERLSGRGVSYCAVCDGAFHRGKVTAVVGGGNTALEDALSLSRLCETVHLVHRRDSFRGSRVLVEAVEQRENIVIHYDTVVEEIVGEQRVERLILRGKDGQREELALSGVFVAAGSLPQNEPFAGSIPLDTAGYAAAAEDCLTRLPGLFVAGDTRQKAVRQLVTAAADGAVAALAADAYLETRKQ